MLIDVLVVGDALIDFFLTLDPTNEHCRPEPAQSEICFVSGAKIPIEDCEFLLGGNACNVSVGLARLGLRSALAAEIGVDEFGQKIIAGLKQENVDLSFLLRALNQQTSFAIDLTFMNDRTIFSRHVKRDHVIPIENANAKYIYLTSLGDEWKNLYRRVRDYSKANNIKLAFNPGSKQLQAGLESFQYILENTEILFINKEEAEDIVYGHDQNISDAMREPTNLLREVKKKGPHFVSMTDGTFGAYAIDDQGNTYFQPTLPSHFLQKTGVGDAYASGFLAARVEEKSIQEAMLWGALNSSSVVEHKGAQGGLLTKNGLLERMEQNKSESRDQRI